MLSRVRWWILSLIFFATTINYLDRIAFSILMPEIRKEMAIDSVAYGYLNFSFQIAYTLGFVFMGLFVDRYGTKVGYAVALLWWSIAAALHAFSRTPMSLGVWRFLLGLGESGNFPAAIKGVAEWFPKKDRAFATGIFNAGSNVASMVGPPMFVAMTATYGWRASFLITASVGFIWLIIWWLYYQNPNVHKDVNKAELEYINSDVEPEGGVPKIGWLQALTFRETWGFAIAKFLTDPVWWFYLYWLPLFLTDVQKLSMKQMGWALPVVYLMADFGSVFGGWLSGYFMRRGWPNGKARKVTMAICACCMPIAAMAAFARQPIVAIALASIATSAHQGWSANLYTTVSDVFPKQAVASVMGIGGCLGGLGGALFSAIIPGYVVKYYGYTPVFLVLGVFHLIALVFVHKLLGDMRPRLTTRSS